MTAQPGTDYELRLCSSAKELRAAYQLRLEVFHDEQKFPKETEVDDYDPVSAHFIVVPAGREGTASVAIATVRLTPYPRGDLGASQDEKKVNLPVEESKRDDTIPQDKTSIVTAGGGPGGTAGGLPIFSSPSTPQHTKLSDKANKESSEKREQDKEKLNKASNFGLSTPESRARLTEVQEGMDDGTRTTGVDPSYPLGGVQSSESLAHSFRRNLRFTAHVGEGTPKARGAKLSRLAVKKSERGKHLGEQAVRGAEAWLLEVLRSDTGKVEEGQLGSVDMVVSSQMQANGFYERLSYAAQGEPYDEEGAPHMWYAKRLIFERS